MIETGFYSVLRHDGVLEPKRVLINENNKNFKVNFPSKRNIY